MGAFGLAFLVLGTWLAGKTGGAAVAIGAAVLSLQAAPTDPAAALARLPVDLLNQWRGAANLLIEPAVLRQDYARATASVPRLPWHPPGTADIYSNGQSLLFAAGLPWDPRPVIQSYSAYTPRLARLNRDHLLGPRSPDNIFFKPEPIDGRLPALEDGASWPALLSLYQPVSYDVASDLVWLDRAPPGTAAIQPGKTLLEKSATLGDMIPVPQGDFIWASIDARPSLAGAVAGVLYRLPGIKIRLRLTDGSEELFRFIPGMGRAGFLLSPFVASTYAFMALRQPDRDGTRDKRKIAAFGLQVEPSRQWAWRKSYHVMLSSMAIPIAAPAPVPDTAVPRADATIPQTARDTCFLDAVNGALAPRQPMAAYGVILLKGWGAFDVNAGIPADSAAFAFTGTQGQSWTVPATLIDQPGIGDHFHHPDLLRVGVVAQADTSRLQPGSYSVQMILRQAQQAVRCPTVLSLDVPERG